MSELRLSRATHDRSAHLRLDAAALEKAWADPRARVVQVHDSASLLQPDGTDLAYLTPSQIDDDALRMFLGFDPDGVPYFGVDRELVAEGEQRVSNLREISSRLGAGATGLFVHAIGLANWHARNGFCPNCGTGTD